MQRQERRSIKVGGRELSDLVLEQRYTVIERQRGRGFLSGAIVMKRSESLYLLVPSEVRVSLRAMGLDLGVLKANGLLEPEVCITCDEGGEELMLEYKFRVKKEKRRREE